MSDNWAGILTLPSECPIKSIGKVINPHDSPHIGVVRKLLPYHHRNTRRMKRALLSPCLLAAGLTSSLRETHQGAVDWDTRSSARKTYITTRNFYPLSVQQGSQQVSSTLRASKFFFPLAITGTYKDSFYCAHAKHRELETPEFTPCSRVISREIFTQT